MIGLSALHLYANNKEPPALHLEPSFGISPKWLKRWQISGTDVMKGRKNQLDSKPVFIYNTNKMGLDGDSTIHEA